eukprot:g8258.t1
MVISFLAAYFPEALLAFDSVHFYVLDCLHRAAGASAAGLIAAFRSVLLFCRSYVLPFLNAYVLPLLATTGEAATTGEPTRLYQLRLSDSDVDFAVATVAAYTDLGDTGDLLLGFLSCYVMVLAGMLPFIFLCVYGARLRRLRRAAQKGGAVHAEKSPGVEGAASFLQRFSFLTRPLAVVLFRMRDIALFPLTLLSKMTTSKRQSYLQGLFRQGASRKSFVLQVRDYSAADGEVFRLVEAGSLAELQEASRKRGIRGAADGSLMCMDGEGQWTIQISNDEELLLSVEKMNAKKFWFKRKAA